MQKKKKLKAIFSQTVFNVSKEGAEAWHKVAIIDIINKYDGSSLALRRLD